MTDDDKRRIITGRKSVNANVAEVFKAVHGPVKYMEFAAEHKVCRDPDDEELWQ